MKKNNLYKISSLFILLSAMLFASCSGLSAVNEVEDTATISISFTETNARMVLPTLDFENFSNFELKGSLNGSAQETIKTWTTYSDFSSGKDNIKIKPGSWTFVFTCEKGSENFSGTTSATITAGSDATNLSFILNHTQTSAKGTAKITFEWPENTVKSVMYYFGEFYSSSSTEPVLVSSDSLQNNKLEITKNNLDAGNYALQVYFFSLNVTKQDLENQLQSESSKNAMGRIIVDEVLENLVVESGLTTEVNHNLKHLKPVSYLKLTDSDGSDIDLNKKYDYKTIQLNSNWHISFFNEAPKVISVKTVTSNSITFTVNDSNHEMVQVVFGDKPYEQGKTYEISYKSNVDACTMSTCMWVTKAQECTDSNYDNSNNSYTSNYKKFTCDTTDSGGFLFFLPSAVGEYTIYDMQIADSVM